MPSTTSATPVLSFAAQWANHPAYLAHPAVREIIANVDRHLRETANEMEEVKRELRRQQARRQQERASPPPLSAQMRVKALERAKEPCSICYEDDMTNPAVTPCGHVFCKGCIDEYTRVKGVSPPCPLCRMKITSCSELSK